MSTGKFSEGMIILPVDESVQAGVQGLTFNGNMLIKFLPVKISETFPDLLAYSASRCSLTAMNKANFEGLLNLKVLYLYQNQITAINNETFENLIALERLTLCK